jgi:DNA invertase Pin-like site-specific DNA recombinase
MQTIATIAERAGWEVVKAYKDDGISGAKGRDKRPAFDALLSDASGRKFDIVMAWWVDRLGRSLQDLVGFLAELHALKIDLCLKQQGIDTTTPAGKALFGIMGVFAEFERSMIQERVPKQIYLLVSSSTAVIVKLVLPPPQIRGTSLGG